MFNGYLNFIEASQTTTINLEESSLVSVIKQKFDVWIQKALLLEQDFTQFKESDRTNIINKISKID